MRIFTLLLMLLLAIKCYTQDQQLEIYLRKNPSKHYIVKLDDDVLIKCRHFEKGYNKLVVARFGRIDSIKFYFYPIDKNYRESIYTLSTMSEIGIKTTFYKFISIYDLTMRVRYLINGRLTYLNEDDRNYKMLNLKSRKWSVRLLEL
jgi:hypothetical protein